METDMSNCNKCYYYERKRDAFVRVPENQRVKFV